jgi:hypothetical protein
LKMMAWIPKIKYVIFGAMQKEVYEGWITLLCVH